VHEADKPYPAPDADWIEAQRRVFGKAAGPTNGVDRGRRWTFSSRFVVLGVLAYLRIGMVLAFPCWWLCSGL
jgi:hypothetical protein